MCKMMATGTRTPSICFSVLLNYTLKPKIATGHFSSIIELPTENDTCTKRSRRELEIIGESRSTE
jgi:hypothetical protein